jgi:hypothetical protein
MKGSIDITKEGSDLKAWTKYRETAVDFAAKGRYEEVKKLLESSDIGQGSAVRTVLSGSTLCVSDGT